MKNKRKICILSGKRGGFGALIRLMNMIRDDPKMELQLVLTDMHLADKFGYTLKEVKKQFRPAALIDLKQKGDSEIARAQALSRCFSEIIKVLDKLKPDIMFVFADRGEHLVGAYAALLLGIPIAHAQGGDISGNIDEVQRHAISKLAHIHFPETKASAKRLLKLGEEKWRIHQVGSVYIDIIKYRMYTPLLKAKKKIGLKKNEDFVILLYHPDTTDYKKSYKQMKVILKAVASFSLKTVVVYPCSDPGHNGIIKAIEEKRNSPQFLIFKNIEAPVFKGLMTGAKALIGNSSSGIKEAPYLRLPFVNIGNRQNNREKEKNVINVEPTYNSVIKGIQRALFDKKFKKQIKNCGYLFGDGYASERIYKILKNIKLNKKLKQKRLTF